MVTWVIKYYWMLNISIAINSPTTIIGIIWDFMGYDGNLGQYQIISNYMGNWIWNPEGTGISGINYGYGSNIHMATNQDPPCLHFILRQLL